MQGMGDVRMAEVLSQAEIDALLTALSSGKLNPDDFPKEEEKQKVKYYDFRSPQKFSKDLIRSLELIHENYARIISNYLSAQVRTNVKIDIISTQQITYDEFIHSLPNPTILMKFRMSPLKGSILFEMSSQFIFQIIDILLGGSVGNKHKVREFTDIDKNIILLVTKGIIESLKLAWDEILEVEVEVEGLETNPAFNQTLAPNEPVVLITFSCEIGKDSTFINICIPYLSIEKVIESLVVNYNFQQTDEESIRDSRVKMKHRLNIVDLNITAMLGKASITVDDFLRLTVGDVVTLNERSTNAIKVYVEDVPRFEGMPGIIGNNMGIQILDITDKDVDTDE
jgi:flagellar motor switch protein FliM